MFSLSSWIYSFENNSSSTSFSNLCVLPENLFVGDCTFKWDTTWYQVSWSELTQLESWTKRSMPEACINWWWQCRIQFQRGRNLTVPIFPEPQVGTDRGTIRAGQVVHFVKVFRICFQTWIKIAWIRPLDGFILGESLKARRANCQL